MSDFSADVLRSMVGGLSALDVPSLNVHTREAALAFVRGYGYDLENDRDAARLWSLHRRAVTYIQTQLLDPGERVPESVAEPERLGDLAQLLILASQTPVAEPLQRWACAILRVMHVLSHLTNDLFTSFAEPIQEQVLSPIQAFIHAQGDGRLRLGRSLDDEEEGIWLERFEIKPFKTSNSSITKLLAKPTEVAFGLLDRLGVRFVTESVFDAFRVLQFLHDHHVVVFPNLIPDQANNTLFPLNVFLDAVKEPLPPGVSRDEQLHRLLARSPERAEYREKLNLFTSRDYRFIKFISRRLIRAPLNGLEQPLMFYYPFEVQIVDHRTHVANASGPGSHDQYKARQRRKARERVLL